MFPLISTNKHNFSNPIPEIPAALRDPIRLRNIPSTRLKRSALGLDPYNRAKQLS
jgi:hypothetical protein